MKKYVLIYSQERELSVKGVFDTLPEAQVAMQKDFQKYFLEDVGMSEEEYYEMIEEQDECADDAFIDEMYAWSSYDLHMSLDWKIEEIEFEV